jgi:L-fuconolactonase
MAYRFAVNFTGIYSFGIVTMRIIDIHPHIISGDTARYPRSPLGGKQSKWSEEHSVDYDAMVREMDETGVEKSILVQSSTCYGYDNSFVADAIAAHPNRLGGVCSIDARAADAPQKLQYWVSRGFSGVRLFMSGSTMTEPESWFSEPVCVPFWSKAADLGLPVCLQTHWKTLPQVKETVARFSSVKVILDHLVRAPVDDGPAYDKAKPLFELSQYPNVFLKLTPVNVKDVQAVSGSPEIWMKRLVEVFGSNKIAWGSNFPSTTATLKEAYDMNWNAASGLGAADKKFIFGKTALSLYPKLA